MTTREVCWSKGSLRSEPFSRVVPCRVVPRSNSAIFEGSLWSTREVKLAIDELGIAEGTFVMLFDG